ncbi:hypothetical protein SHVI106290_03470 [Shewanella violacea]
MVCQFSVFLQVLHPALKLTLFFISNNHRYKSLKKHTLTSHLLIIMTHSPNILCYHVANEARESQIVK